MEEIKDNEYVRTNYGIFRSDTIFMNSHGASPIKETDIVKHSPNIIDLIEVGDVVEVFMEMDLDEEDTNIFEVVGITVDKDEIAIFNKDLEFDFVPIGNIRRVLTKEQFKSVSFEV